ncbi:MAG: hypothetical protein Fur0018_12070 [Anaerolineales bacterium]
MQAGGLPLWDAITGAPGDGYQGEGFTVTVCLAATGEFGIMRSAGTIPGLAASGTRSLTDCLLLLP